MRLKARQCLSATIICCLNASGSRRRGVVSPKKDIAAREKKKVRADAVVRQTVNIDSFNEIITLEVAKSGALVLR
jgi:hypothetical protein